MLSAQPALAFSQKSRWLKTVSRGVKLTLYPIQLVQHIEEVLH
jgi:hypothetical protein